MKNKKQLWAVFQYQPGAYATNETVSIFDAREKAEKDARALNKQYGAGVVFDRYFNFIELPDDADDNEVHYYFVEPIILNQFCSKKGRK